MEVAASTLQIKGGGYGCVRRKYSSCVNMEIRWVSSSSSSSNSSNSASTTRRRRRRRRIPVYISTDPSHVNPDQLHHLFSSCNHSSHRFPHPHSTLDLHKLRTALSHSSLLVSVFSMNPPPPHGDDLNSPGNSLVADLLQQLQLLLLPPSLSPSHSQLVGFGRAVSDSGLTASIHDVVVIPSMRGLGIGKMIVKRIVRMLTSRDIYDISALCSPHERLFFEACGFGDDILGSTTMMYTRGFDEGDEQLVTHAGGKLLVAPPPLRVPYKYSKDTKSQSGS